MRDMLTWFALVGAAVSFALPTKGTRYMKWWLRGAYEDVLRKCRMENVEWRMSA